jgi:capreomycidine synthase
MRQYYFNTKYDLGSSGVEPFSFGELRELLELTEEDLNRIVFHDSTTLGGLDLRKAIAGRWGNGDPDTVMAAHGSSEAIYLTMQVILREGDEVVVLNPCYQQLSSIAESIGCGLRPWPLRSREWFVPDIEVALRLINSRTRMVIMNFPHNPTGVSISEEALERLIGAVAKVGAYLVWDAAFGDLNHWGTTLISPTLNYDRAITIGTLSKAYGLPGLRVGWCIASPRLLSLYAHLRDYTTLHLSPFIELIACRAIQKAGELLALRMGQVRANLAFLENWMSERRELVDWRAPQGGVCAFPRLLTIPDVEEFCHRLADDYDVLLVPGACFHNPQHVRLGFGGSTNSFQEGMSRLSDALSKASSGSGLHRS